MSVTDLRGRISTVNATVSRLNEQRVRNMGMRETLEKQKSDAIASYLEKYGVDLNVVNVQEEFQRVMAVKQAEVDLMTEVIGCIDNGDFARANQLLNIGASDTNISTPQTTESTPVSAPQVSAVNVPVSEPVSAPVQTPVQSGVAMSGVDSLVPPTPVVPTVSNVVQPTVAPTPAVAPPPLMSGLGAVGSVPIAPPVAPPPLGMPTTHHAVGSGLDLSSLQVNTEMVNRATDFSGILGGQPFIP